MKFLCSSALIALALSASPILAEHSPRHMHVYKTEGCECCSAWAEIARAHGFDVTVDAVEDISRIKRSKGVPEAVESCHTATIDGYVVEGHVPMEAVDRMLEERPSIRGIAAPGMPAGSPGMGDDPDARFDVLSFGGTGATGTAVFHEAGAD